MGESEIRNRLFRIASEGTDNCLLLLSLILVLDGSERANRFTFAELESVFLEQMGLVDDLTTKDMALERPFCQFRADGFWYFKAKEGKEDFLGSCEEQMTKEELLESLEYVYLAQAEYDFLADRANRETLETELVALLVNTDTKPLAVREGTSLYQHEQQAIDRIEQQVRAFNLGRLVSNINIYDEATNNYFECDVVLIAHSGIFIIELKHWSGHTDVRSYQWLRNGTNYIASPHVVNSTKCKTLKGIYQHQFRTFPDIWVESVVVLTHPNSTVEGASHPSVTDELAKHNPTFASIADLITYLRKKNTQCILNDRQIDSITSYLCDIGKVKKGIEYTIPGYETVDYLYQTPNIIEMVARPLGGHARGLVRFRIFRPPTEATHVERERFIKKAYATIKAVSEIGDHPNIHKVMAVPNEYDDIMEMSDWSETGTLRDLLIKTKAPLSASSAMEISLGIAHALRAAHKVHVIHRAVKPENILLMNDIPKLTNFDFSYQLEDNRLTVISKDALKDDGYVAPEVLNGEDIDEGTDLFSLAAITYEMLTGQKAFSKTREFMSHGGILDNQATQRLMKVDNLSSEAKEAIMSMLVGDRRDRMRDIDKVIAIFSEHEGDKQKIHRGHNARLNPGDDHDVYRIIELVGEGREAQVYVNGHLRIPILGHEISSR